MDSKEMKESLPLPQAMRLKTIGAGVFVKQVKGRRLLVRSVIPHTEMDKYKKAGLVLPDGLERQYTPIATYGPIVQVGEGCDEEEWQEGMLVLFGKFSGTDFTMQNEDFRLIHEDEILAVLDVDLETFGAVPVKEE